jgi:catalase
MEKKTKSVKKSNETAKTEQLKKETRELGEFLTTNQGLKISDNQNTLKAGERGPALLEDFQLREKIMHFDHERIPERVVHARGAAAHGYFQVYKSMKEYTKAGFLQDPSVKTPVFVRFSTVAGFRGSADTVRDVRGFATKFYTGEGNFDLVGNNIPIFFIQDAIKFPDFIHAVKPEPNNEIPQASSAHDNFWDFISLTPESLHMIMWVLSDRALPRSYSMMEGFGIHTFRFINAAKKSRFIKFHWKPLNGIHSIRFEEAQLVGGKDPDFNRRDLWESIERGNYPEYELGVQILEENELNKIEFDILDPTKLWPEEDVPVKLIGKMTLNRNPDNFFAETEQVAFHPGHLVPGIDFTNDPLLQGRLFSYLDTQLTRLGGPNFHEIPINRPIASVHNNQQDGLMRQTIDKGRVNYEPNSLGGGCPMQAAWNKGGFISFPEQMEGEKIRKRPESFGDHYSQASLFWNSMSNAEKRHIIEAFHFELGKVKHKHIRVLMLEHLNHINRLLAVEVAKGLGLEHPKEIKGKIYSKKSPALSQANHQPNLIRGRNVAILAAEGVDKSQIEEISKLLNEQGAAVEVVSKNLGILKAKGNGKIEIHQNYSTTSSVMFDAVLVPGGSESVKTLLKQKEALKFIQEAYHHCKPIAAIGEAVKVLQAASLTTAKFASGKSNAVTADLGVVTVGDAPNLKLFFNKFKEALVHHRYWEREEF